MSCPNDMAVVRWMFCPKKEKLRDSCKKSKCHLRKTLFDKPAEGRTLNDLLEFNQKSKADVAAYMLIPHHCEVVSVHCGECHGVLAEQLCPTVVTEICSVV